MPIDCLAADPLVTLSPAMGMAKLNTYTNYTVTVSNQDSGACAQTTFTLTYSDNSSSVTGTLIPTTLSLGPGQSGTATFQVKGSSAGAYTVSIQVSAPNHNAITASTSFTADNTKPTTPTNLQAVASTGQVQLNWTASTDTYSGIQSYIVYRNNAPIAYPLTPSYTDTTAVKGQSYKYTVAAQDKVGNISSQSSSKTVTAK